MISQAMLDRLVEQYAHETCNSLRYFQRSTFAEFRGLDGIASFFKKQAEGERSHADAVFRYVNDRNVQLPIAGLAFPDPDMLPSSDPVEIFLTAAAIEQRTTAMLQAVLEQARSDRDYLTEQWLLDSSGLLKEQVEEENLYQTILDRVASMGDSPSLIHDLDIWIAETFGA
jgi:ferritin